VTAINAGVERGGEEERALRGERWRSRLRARVSPWVKSRPRCPWWPARRRACLRRTSRRWKPSHPSRVIRGPAGGR